MEEDVILEEVPDSDIELGHIALPHSNKKEKQGKKIVRSKVPSFSFRKLRSKTFAQRHVYTVDLCKFLNLESEVNLERIAARLTDEEVMEHLNRIYILKKEQYDSKGLKRHKFTKQTFQMYVEDFKRYEKNRQGKSFYDTIQDDLEETVPNSHNLVNNHTNKHNHPKIVAKSPRSPQRKRDVDHLIPIKRNEKSSRLRQESIDIPAQNLHSVSEPVATDPFAFPLHSTQDSPQDATQQSSRIEADVARPIEAEVVEPIVAALMPLPVLENEDGSEMTPGDLSPVPIENANFNTLDQSEYTKYTGRSLRQRKFSQNHVYTVDLCGYLGLLTRSELDSYSESGIPDEDIFRKLDLLYEERVKKHPGLKKDKFKFSNFLSHLEHHTKKYQKRYETSNQPTETFSSQIVEDSSSEEEEMSSENEEAADTLIALKERKRLKGVLPFSYLKLQGATLEKKDLPMKHKIDTPDRIGFAKRKIGRKGHSENIGDGFIDDSTPIEEYSPNRDNYMYMNSETTPSGEEEITEISDSDESVDQSDIEMFGPFSLSETLFGPAEEDRSSGIDHMLSRSSKPQGHKPISKRRKRTIKTVIKSKGTSTWSTSSKRIYHRSNLGQAKRPMRQSHMPFRSIGDSLPGNAPNPPSREVTPVQLKTGYQGQRHNYISTSTNSKLQQGQGSPRLLPDEIPRQQRDKKKKTKSYYGVAPNLSIHSLSRAPQSYTTQLEVQSHKYAIVNMQNHSKENLNPLEPPGIFTIPEEYPVEEAYNTVFESAAFGKFEELHEFHKRGLENLDGYLNSQNDQTEIDTIAYKLDGTSFTLSKLNSNSSPLVMQRSFALLRRYLMQRKSANQKDNEYIFFLYQVAKWLNCTGNISDQYASGVLSELKQLLEVLLDTNGEIIHKGQQTGRFMLILISLTILNLMICEKILGSYGQQSNTQISSVATRLIRSYLIYVFACETPDSFYNTLSGSDSRYYESLSLVGMTSKYLIETSFWSEVHLVFQKYGNTNEVHRMVEYIRIFQAFATETSYHWKPIISILKFSKKLVGFSQLSSTKLVIDLIFDLEQHWELDDSIITAVYGLLSTAKFRNFSGETSDLNLKYEVGTHHYKEDSIMDSYFKLLTIYLSKNKGSPSLLEKVMPISSVDFEIQSDEVFINRVNVLLVYSNLFHQNFSKQLNILLKISDMTSESRLEIAFDAFCILAQMDMQNGKKVKLESIKDVVIKFVRKFNSILTVKIDSAAIQKNSQFVQKVIDKILEFFESHHQFAKFDLLRIACELFNLKFHATTLLDRLLANITSLIKTSVTYMENGNFEVSSEQGIFLKNDFYDSMTALLGLQLSSFVPYKNSSQKISNLVAVWCHFSDYLVSRKLLDWNSVLFYHWNNIAGSLQREYFELQLLESVLDSSNTKDLQNISSGDFLLRALSRHIVKFNSERIFNYLTKLIRVYSENDIVLANSFNVDSKQQFDSSRVQIVISYVYYLKKTSTESVFDFKKSESLMMELLRSLDKEYEIQNRQVINFVWFCHFATKIVKFINYSCSDLVKNSIEFSKLRSKLAISYHSDIDYAEKFKEKLSSVGTLENVVKTMEQEMLSSLIQGKEANLKFIDILKSLIVDQLNNLYQKNLGEDEEAALYSSSPLYPLTILMTAHIQILYTKGSFTNWFMLESYLKITVECVLQKGSLSGNDILCLMRTVQNFSMIPNVEISMQYSKDYKNLVLDKVYQLLTIIYNLLTTYADQERFLKIASVFIDSRSIAHTDITQNIDYLNCIRILNEEVPRFHDKVQDIINNIVKDSSSNSDWIKVSLERSVANFINLIKQATPLYIDF